MRAAVTQCTRVDMPVHISSYEAALEYLYGFHRPDPPAAPRGPTTQRLLKDLGVRRTQQSARIGHVTGTNGKGSTCAYLELFLHSSGRRTVALTSPHNNSVRERIRLDGQVISKAMFVELMQQAALVLEGVRDTPLHPRPTTVITVLAMLLHEHAGPEVYGVYEVGAGGEHDSTNVFASAVVGLTTVGDDHLEQFGGSLEGVLLEKLALCRSGGALFYQPQSESLQQMLETYCVQQRVIARPIRASDVAQANEALRPTLLPGPWQAENAALAYQMFNCLEPGGPEIELLGQRATTRRIVHPGRAERRFIGERRLLLDGAHNEPAFECLLNYLATDAVKYELGRLTAIVGVSRSKKWKNLIDRACASGLFAIIVFTRSTRPRGVEPLELATYASSVHGTRVVQAQNLRHALGWALEKTSESIAIFGSLLLVGDYDKALHALGLHEWAVPAEDIDPEQPWMHTL